MNQPTVHTYTAGDTGLWTTPVAVSTMRLSPSRRARSWGVRVSTVNRSGLTAPATAVPSPSPA